MSTSERWDASKVRPVAEKLVEYVTAACERVEIAGSLRRGKKMVGDIELVLIEKTVLRPGSGLFSEPDLRSLLAPILHQLEDVGKLVPLMTGGQKMKKYRVGTVKRELNVDMFIVHPDGWGNQLAIRTGPSSLSRRMVTQQCRGGLLNDAYAVRGGFVWKSRSDVPPPGDGTQPPAPYSLIDGDMYELVPCPEESDFMALLSCGYVKPNKRKDIA